MTARRGSRTRRRLSQRKRRPRKAIARQRRERSLLVLECDADKLASQGIKVGGEVEGLCRLVAPTWRVAARTKADALEQLGSLALKGVRPWLIVVIGHSNEKGLQLSGDAFVSWAAFAEWIAPFAPENVVILGCRAGRWLPCSALFGGVKPLKAIFASPHPLTAVQAPLKVLVPYLLLGEREDRELTKLGLIFNFATTGGAFLVRRRADFTKARIEDGIAYALLDELIERAVRR